MLLLLTLLVELCKDADIHFHLHQISLPHTYKFIRIVSLKLLILFLNLMPKTSEYFLKCGTFMFIFAFFYYILQSCNQNNSK